MLPENIQALLAEDDKRLEQRHRDFDNWLIERAKIVKLQDDRFLRRMDRKFDQLSDIRRSMTRCVITTTVLMGVIDALSWTVTVHYGL